MDRAQNPFARGAGSQPPELAGRAQIVRDAEIALKRITLGNPTRSQLLLGLRGVGKTVLLNRIEELADSAGQLTITLEAPEDRPLPQILVPPLRAALVKLSRIEKSRELARRGLSALRAFASAFKVEIGDVGFMVTKEHGTADSGDIEADLAELLWRTMPDWKPRKRLHK